MKRKLVVWGCVALVSGMCAAPASAAFPGRNGKLVAAAAGRLDLVNPRTGAATSICTNSLLCGDPTQPHVSPNGRAIVFVDARTSRLVVVAPDGTCLWCLLGPRPSRVTGRAPAFTANGMAVTLTGGGLRQVSLSGVAARRLVKGAVGSAVWSSHGLVALVRGGWVWVGRPGRGALRRLARGASPSFSPDGSAIALVRGGYVWIVRVRDGARRRLARGTSPAWSPDGHQIAYVGRSGTVEIVPARGGRSHRVGSLRATALDWQPQPGAPAHACTPARGATIAASNAEGAVEAVTRSGTSAYTTAWYGCLRALGHWRLLTTEHGTVEGGPAILWHVGGLAGRFAAFEGLHYCTKYQQICSSGQAEVRVYDLTTGHASLSPADPCEGNPEIDHWCSVDSLSVDSVGFAAWWSAELPATATGMYGVSCPSTSLCVAVDQDGDVLSTTSPTGPRGAWSNTHVENSSFLGVSCPSPSFCAVASNDGNVVISTDPTGGAGAWKVTRLPGSVTVSLSKISCAKPSMCVGVGQGTDGAGYVAVSNDPTGGSGAWTVSKIDTTVIDGVSCPTASLCVAIDRDDNVLTSTNPGGGSAAWSSFRVNGGLSAVSCPSTSLCVASGFYGGDVVASSTNPTGGPGAWSISNISDDRAWPSSALSCPSASLCVAIYGNGEVFTSTDPTGGGGAWTVTRAVDTSGSPTAISCPSSTLCIAVDATRGDYPPNDGNVLSTTDPTGGGSWTRTFVDAPASCATRPCIAEQIYAHDDQGTHLIDAAPPGTGQLLATPRLSGDLLTLTWTRAGTLREHELR